MKFGAMNEQNINTVNTEVQKVIEVIAKFKSDLLWDDIVGVFEMTPKGTKDLLEKQYIAALKAASEKYKIDLTELQEKVEDLAYTSINGLTYSDADIKARLKEYGIEQNN